MNRLLEWLKLMRDLPHGQGIFLRKEYDQLNKKLRPVASWHRRRRPKKTRIVAVVGSLGKSTTRKVLSAVLGCPERNFSPSNYGTSFAHNLLRVRHGDAYAVLEAGVFGPGNMTRLAQLVRPDIAVVTSIASEHNRSFPTLLDTREEKVNMVRALSRDGVAILNGDDPNVLWMASQTQARVVTYGIAEACDVRAVPDEAGSLDGSSFQALIGSDSMSIRSHLKGPHMIYPLLAALAVAWVEKRDLSLAACRLSEVSPLEGRIESITLNDGTLVLDDSFKASMESIHTAFATFSKVTAPRKILVLGTIDEPPGSQGNLYRSLGVEAAAIADVIICIGGDCMRGVRVGAKSAGMDASCIHLVGTQVIDGLQLVQSLRKPGDAILVKGSHGQRFRRIVLGLKGEKHSCSLKYCAVKVPLCDICPLLDAPPRVFENGLVKRFLKNETT